MHEHYVGSPYEEAIVTAGGRSLFVTMTVLELLIPFFMVFTQSRISTAAPGC